MGASAKCAMGGRGLRRPPKRVHRTGVRRTVTTMIVPVNAELLLALGGMPPIPDLAGAVMAALGADNTETYDQIPVLGYHLSVGVDTASVYTVTDRIFALFEANSVGRSYTLSISLPRIRRVARFEDNDYTRVIIEIDADRATTSAAMNTDGRSDGVVIPAGYELLENDPVGRAALRRFQRALTTAIAL